MEFTIVKERLYLWKLSSNSNSQARRHDFHDKRLTLGYGTDSAGDLNDGKYSGVNYFRKGLMDILCNHNISIWPGRWYIGSSPESLRLMVDLTMTSSKTATVKILTRNGSLGEFIRDVQIFDGLINSALSPASYGFNLKLTLGDLYLEGSEEYFQIKGEDLKISKLEEDRSFGLEIKDVEITDEIWKQWEWSEDDGNEGDNQDADSDACSCCGNGEVPFEGKIELTLRLDHCAVKKLYLEGLGKKYYGDCSSDLTIGGIDTDMAILVGGEKDKEKGIKCHKKILSDCSPVFLAMFQVDMTESKDSCVEIVDMTDAGVRAMLQFIYEGDLEVALENCEIALELLEAGHKYQMENLEDAMMQIVWAKPADWLSVDLVLKLLLFSRNAGGWKFEKMEKTSLAILKWYCQKKPGSLMASEEYRRLFLEFPRIAMELGESFLKI